MYRKLKDKFKKYLRGIKKITKMSIYLYYYYHMQIKENVILIESKDLFKKRYPDAEIYLIDSTLASIGYGMLCIWAADARDMDKTPQECIENIESRKIGVNTYYTTNDLKYLYHSGRVTKSKAVIAATLDINPILNLDREGHLIVREKIRGRKRALMRIYDIVDKLAVKPHEQIVYICHSDCEGKEVRSFSDALIDRFGFKGSFISYIGPTIGSHCGPGLIAAFFEGNKDLCNGRY
jgi:DegV family protein with EDD domain